MTVRPRYQHEPVELREAIWESGVIAPLQMMRIAAWKSARGLAPLTLNSQDAIETRSHQLLEAIRSFRRVDVIRQPLHTDEWDRWRLAAAAGIGSKSLGTGLLGLDGFGYPMASAFLALLAPNAFPVIDRWTVKAVYGPTSGNYQRSVVYADFTRCLVSQAVHYPSADTVHGVDQSIMNAAMSCDHGERPCKCLPFAPSVMPD